MKREREIRRVREHEVSLALRERVAEGRVRESAAAVELLERLTRRN